MKRIYYFLVNCGKVIFVWAVLFIISISFYSLTIKGKVNYGNRCYHNFDDSFIIEYKYDGIEMKNGYLECNTYYLQYNSSLSENENLLFLISLAKLFYDNEVSTNVHVIIKNNNYQVLSTIVDYKVSYTISLI